MKCGMIFPGYGNQFVGMGKELYDTQRLVQEYFEEAATCLSVNFVKLCFASSEVELARPCHAYTSLFLMGAASAGLLKERSITPSAVAGVDITSWYSSLFAAGSISLPDGLYMLNKLGTAYEEMLSKNGVSALLVKDSTKKKVEQLCQKVSTAEQLVAIAQIVAQGFIVAGDARAIERLQLALAEVPGVTYEAADINGGLYMSAVEDVVVQVNSYLEKIDFKDPQITLLSPLNGKVIKKSSDIKKLATILFVQQLDQRAVIQKLAQYDRVCIAIPATRMRSQLAQELTHATFDLMDTVAEFEALESHYRTEEQVHVE